MDGNPVFKWAAYTMSKTAAEALDAAGSVPMILMSSCRIRRICESRTPCSGHSSCRRRWWSVVTSPTRATPRRRPSLAIETLLDSGEARSGQTCLIIGFGAGLVYAGQVIVLPKLVARLIPFTTEGVLLMPTTEEVRTDLAEIVNEVAGVPADDVQLDKSFTDDLDVDSLSMVEIIYAAEEKFGVSIPDEEAKNLKETVATRSPTSSAAS